MLTFERLIQSLDYDPDTGIFLWKRYSGNKVAGSDHQGYVRIKLDGKQYMAHRLAWFYTEGYMPENEIDHINRKRDDNRFCNLRHVTRSCNAINKNTFRNNTSGVKGVSFDKYKGKYRAYYCDNGKLKFLGTYVTVKEAATARRSWEKQNDKYIECIDLADI